jgi:hypothetical protein
MRYTWMKTNYLIAIGVTTVGWVCLIVWAYEPAFLIGHNRNATNAKGSPHTASRA